ncbi:MAG: hypothetical protein K2H78_00610 [Clostridia bacterium]|nr:hypothetical protein [Clostridia bacterium]
MHGVKCPGCGVEIVFNGEDALICPRCGSVVTDTTTRLGKGDAERLALAEGYRRIGRFDDSQLELDGLLERHENLSEGEFGCILNYYEVTEYSFDGADRVKTCKCYSTDRRPVDKNKDWLELKEKYNGKQKNQWVALCERIEFLRQRNILIRESLPLYRAIILYDYSNNADAEVAHGLYEILSKKTDVFFPPESLKYVPFDDREPYLMQIISDPDVAPLLFVIYSDAYNLRKKTATYYKNIARQCEDFAKVHTKTEMISVTCDYAPPAMIKRLSVKTIACEDFDKESYGNIAEAMLEKITDATYSDDEYDDFLKGIAVSLNGGELSPLVKPI